MNAFEWKRTPSEVAAAIKPHFNDGNKNGILRVHATSNLSQPIEQLTLDGEVIKRFPSAASAARFLGLPPSSVSGCAAGRIKTCGGFKWRYVPAFKEARSPK